MTSVMRSTNERDLKKKIKKKEREREFSNSELAVATNGGQYPNHE